MGSLDLLRRAKPERQPRLIDNAIQAVERGRSLTSQLLVFGRRHQLRPEVVAVKQLIAATHDMLGQSLRGDIEIRYDLPEDLWLVRADPSQLQIALINLAVNARDAMAFGGVLTLRAENRVLPGPPLAEVVSLHVSDTGTGMSAAVLARVFEPFYTTKEVGRGTGLGLAQVHGFVQQSGGSVEIASEPGRGTVVTLNLPRAEIDARISPAPASGDQRPAAAARRRVLLVEDNAPVAEVGRAILVERGHDVTVCANASDALALLAQGAYDVVCSDRHARNHERPRSGPRRRGPPRRPADRAYDWL